MNFKRGLNGLYRIVFLAGALLFSVSSSFASPITTADHLLGYAVQGARGTPVGHVVALFLDLDKGRVSYVLVKTDDGGKSVVPWQAVRILPDANTLRLSINADRFRQAPPVELAEIDREKERSLHRYFGVAPYWEDKDLSHPSPPRHLRIVR